MTVYTGNAGDNAFTILSGLGIDHVDGGGGIDTLTVDWSDRTNPTGGSFLYPANAAAYLLCSGHRIEFQNIEILNLKFGSGNDGFQFGGTTQIVSLDGGQGQDGFAVDFRNFTRDISFTLDEAPGAISYFIGQGSNVTNVEAVFITTGSGNDRLIGGGEDDVLSGGGGSNYLNGGGGNDRLYCRGNSFVDGGTGDDEFYTDISVSIDGGEGRDYWQGDYRSSIAPVTFTQDGAYSFVLGSGATIVNVESMRLFGSQGSDSFSLGDACGAVEIFGQNGADSLAVDWAAKSDNLELRILSGATFLSAGTDSLRVFEVEQLSVSFGSGDDIAHSGLGDDMFDGGNGDDRVVYTGNFADYDIMQDGDAIIVKDLRPTGNGADTLLNIEAAQFADRLVNFGANTAPFAETDHFETTQDTPFAITSAQLLGNDVDFDGDSIFIDTVSAIYGGDVTVQPDGSFLFTPSPGFTGTASFAYRIGDGRGGFDTASVKVAVGSSGAAEYGSSGSDAYSGTRGDDSFDGLGGDDDIVGNAGDDELFGGNGSDTIRGASGDDILWGDADDDMLSGGAGDDILIGGEGNDILNGVAGYDRVELMGDLADYSFAQDKLGRLYINDSVAGRDGNDVASNVEEFNFGGTVYSFAEVLAII